MAKSIMIQGTMSNAGKSLVAAGLCRIFRQDGFRVAPFKSQNMALNSYITQENLEMGRAQVVQAQAAGIRPSVRMNPVLLKPTTDTGSQVIVNGRVVGDMKAAEYFRRKKEFLPQIMEAYRSLAAETDIIVLEGAGSPAEINLKQDDIVNMGMAKLADAPVLLVGDIDRGGVFAQLYGTIALLDAEEQDRICGLLINKFRGDVKLLEPGLTMLEEKCGKKVLGVIPYADVRLEEEDSLAMQEQLGENCRDPRHTLDIAVIRFPKISNFTDFGALQMEEDVSLRYAASCKELGSPDVILLPGSKNTMQDLKWMRENGLEAAVKKKNANGTPLIGICGGYQMLGGPILDPEGVESGGEVQGLGLLPVETVFAAEKTRRQVQDVFPEQEGFFKKLSGAAFSGYEIHMGQGCRECVRGNVLGSYVHGIFDGEEFRTRLLEILFESSGKQRLAKTEAHQISFSEYRELQFDRLADVLRSSIDLDEIYRIMGIQR